MTTLDNYSQDVARRIRGITADLVQTDSPPSRRVSAATIALDELAAELEVQEAAEPVVIQAPPAKPDKPAPRCSVEPGRLGTIHFDDALGNRSALTVDVVKGGALKLTLGVEALANLGGVVHDLPTCARPGVMEELVGTLEAAAKAKPRTITRDIVRIEQPA